MLYTYDESVEKYGSKYLLKKAVESGEIFRQDKGVYSDKKYVSEDIVIAAKYPKAVFTLDSAFYYYNRYLDLFYEANANWCRKGDELWKIKSKASK